MKLKFHLTFSCPEWDRQLPFFNVSTEIKTISHNPKAEFLRRNGFWWCQIFTVASRTEGIEEPFLPHKVGSISKYKNMYNTGLAQVTLFIHFLYYLWENFSWFISHTLKSSICGIQPILNFIYKNLCSFTLPFSIHQTHYWIDSSGFERKRKMKNSQESSYSNLSR